ncbi:MAG: rhodanese-like domain-containing protein [Desulfobacterales bacterium]|jgi:sodium/bile acid cotransporter 7
MSLRCCFALLIAVMTGLGSPAAGKTAISTDAQKLSAVYRLYAGYKREFPSVKDIAPDEARAEFTAGAAVFVDTRTSAEIAVSKIPGAVTEEQFRKDPQRYAGKTAIAYCTISYRSGLFAEKMAERGIQVVNLRGGILAWTLEGGQVVDPQGRAVRRLHVYGEKWNYAPEGYEVVMFGWLERLLGQRPWKGSSKQDAGSRHATD